MKTAIALQITMFACALSFPVVSVQANESGDLDQTFGTGGKTSVNFRTDIPAFSYGADVAIQADGKVLSVGSSRADGDEALLVRWNADGSLDSGFGVGGHIRTHFVSGNRESGERLAIQADGRILIGGFTHEPATDASYPTIYRLFEDGTPDPSFGQSGGVIVPMDSILSEEPVRALQVQGDGKIVAVLTVDLGSGSQGDMACFRLLSDGSLDPSFGTDGKVIIDAGGAGIAESASDGVIQGDGKILMAGRVDRDIAMVRLNADGSLDSSFGSGGIAIHVDSQVTRADAVAVQGDGKILIGAVWGPGANKDFAAFRFHQDGSLDSDFGTGGRATVDVAGDQELAFDIEIAPGDRIVVSGWARVGSANDFAWARFFADGSLDTVVSVDVSGSFDNGGRVAMSPSGSFIQVGGALTGDEFDLACARFVDGALDPSFSGDGVALFDLQGPSEDYGSSMSIRDDGKILIAGTVGLGQAESIGVVRLDEQGHLDATFGDDGLVLVDHPDANYLYNGRVASPPGGGVLCAGTVDHPSSSGDFFLAKLQEDGSLDTSFGVGGRVTTDFSGDFDQLSAMAVGDDGKIVTVGLSYGSTQEFALARYNPDGSLDTSFGADGRETYLPPGASEGSLRALALMSDGGLAAAGTLDDQFFVARFDSDASFLWHVATDFSAPDERHRARSVTIQADGKILAAGYRSGENSRDFAIMRLMPDGTLDSSFGVDGLVIESFGVFDQRANAISLGLDGTIAVAGSVGDEVLDFALLVLNPDGSRRTSFKLSGWATTDFDGGYDVADAIGFQSRGRLLLAGSADVQSADFAVARYLFDVSCGMKSRRMPR